MLFTPYEIEVSQRILKMKLKEMKLAYKWNEQNQRVSRDIYEDYYETRQQQLKDIINALESTIFKIETLK